LNAHEQDLALVRRVLEKDARAYQELQAVIAPVVDKRLRRARDLYPAIRANAEDLRQELYMLLVENDFALLRSYEGRSALSTWIYAIATRFFFRRARWETNRAERTERRDRGSKLGAPDVSPEAATMRIEQIDGVRAAIAGLSDEEQILVKMIYETEASASVVGRVLGISDAGVRMKKKRVLAKLAEMLAGLWP
jgi:RNA polymerase sigma factor (sigma-70 family)